MPAPPDHAARALRVPLGPVSDQRARELLTKYRSIIVYQANRAFRTTERAFFVTTRDEFQAVAEAAVLEAFVTYRAGDTSRETVENGGMRRWVWRTVQSRLSDYTAALKRELRTSSDSRADSHNGVLRAHATEERSPETAAYSKQAHRWMLQAIGRLEPRERTILCAVIFEDESLSSIASELGLGRSTAWKVYHETLDKMKQWALSEGIENASFEVGQ